MHQILSKVIHLGKVHFTFVPVAGLLVSVSVTGSGGWLGWGDESWMFHKFPNLESVSVYVEEWKKAKWETLPDLNCFQFLQDCERTCVMEDGDRLNAEFVIPLDVLIINI